MTAHPDDMAALVGIEFTTNIGLDGRLAEASAAIVIAALDAARAKRLPKEGVEITNRLLRYGSGSVEALLLMREAAGLLLTLSAQVEAATARAEKAEEELVKFERNHGIARTGDASHD